jgi:hypothetical protein
MVSGFIGSQCSSNQGEQIGADLLLVGAVGPFFHRARVMFRVASLTRMRVVSG